MLRRNRPKKKPAGFRFQKSYTHSWTQKDTGCFCVGKIKYRRYKPGLIAEAGIAKRLKGHGDRIVCEYLTPNHTTLWINDRPICGAKIAIEILTKRNELSEAELIVTNVCKLSPDEMAEAIPLGESISIDKLLLPVEKVVGVSVIF